MRGGDEQQAAVFSYVTLEQRVPQEHPLRRIRAVVNQALRALSSHLDTLYAERGRPSIAPEKLLRALLLQALYSKRSERLLMEELDYNLLFRWFVGLEIDDAVWDATVFSKNRDRLIEGEVAARFFAAVGAQLQAAGLLSDEHFIVDGTLLEAWASRRSFHEKPDPPARGSGKDGEKLLRDTHESSTDGEARLYRKQRTGGAAQPSYMGHVLSEAGHGLLLDACVTEAGSAAERVAALHLLDQHPGRMPRTLAADKAYQQAAFLDALRARGIVPHIAEYEKGEWSRRKNSMRAEERESARRAHSHKKRKLVEQSFAWIKHWAGLRQVKLRGRRRVEWVFQIAAAAFNLVRMTKLLAPAM